MARVKFNAIPLDNRIEASLEQIVENEELSVDVIRRAKAIMKLWEGNTIKQVVEDLGYNRKSVAKFRKRFQEKADYLNSLALSEDVDDQELVMEVIASLSDKKRTGKPLLYPPEVRERIVALANTELIERGKAKKITLPHIRKTIIDENLVENISIPTIWRIVNSAKAKQTQAMESSC